MTLAVACGLGGYRLDGMVAWRARVRNRRSAIDLLRVYIFVVLCFFVRVKVKVFMEVGGWGDKGGRRRCAVVSCLTSLPLGANAAHLWRAKFHFDSVSATAVR